jgi:hypothetical protein
MRAISILILGLSLIASSTFAFSTAHSQVVLGVSVNVEPPPLPVYDQPPIPAPGYMWAPGYWAWDDDTGYYWVPGTWVMPPEPELLWTPGYWGWSDDGVYAFHEGYWGPQIGFYGGVAYGFGYTGLGYEGGYWRNGAFFYNQSVNNISNVSITNVYNKTVVVNNTTNVSYNGGAGGTTAQPTPEQIAAANERHVPPTAAQTQNVQAAAKDPSLSLNNNQGHPTVAATAHPAEFKGPGVSAAHPGKPIAAISPQGHTVNSPGRTVNTPGAKVGPSAATPRNPPAEEGNKVAPNNAMKEQGSKGGPGTTAATPNQPQIKEHAGTPSSGQPSTPGPTTQPTQLPTTAARPSTPEAARPAPPSPPHAVAPAAPPPPHAAAPAPPHPAASAAPPRPAAPPPHPAAPAAKPKCPPGEKC